MENIWGIALSVGGLGALAFFVFFFLYKGWLKLKIFSQLSSRQTYRLMIIFLVLTFVFSMLALILYSQKDNNRSRKISPPITLEMLENATYYFEDEDEEITLQHGRRSFPAGLEHGEMDDLTMEIIDKYGYLIATLTEVAFGDINHDNSQDAIAVVHINRGGSGGFSFLFPVINKDGNAMPLSGTYLGDRIDIKSVSIRKNIITVEALMHGENDAWAFPTDLRKFSYKLRNQTLYCITPPCGE